MSDHFDGKVFFNVSRVATGSFQDFIKWRLNNQRAKWPSWVPLTQSFPKPSEVTAEQSLRVTFVTHASLLIQYRGINAITDPIWSRRCSPVSWAGPERVRPPGFQIEDLPPIDVVLVSHNHYDHLDLPTLHRLERAHRPLILTSLGNKIFLEREGFKNVKEMDWWDVERVPSKRPGHSSVDVTFTPAQHFSSRSLSDRNKTLWGGFHLARAHSPSVLFAGDTGYSQHFAEIKNRLGAPDVALLPIGAYEPRWFMKHIHMNPEDAVQAHVDLGCAQSIGMHFGTFQLTDEGIDEPVRKLAEFCDARQISRASFVAPEPGQAFNFEKARGGNKS